MLWFWFEQAKQSFIPLSLLISLFIIEISNSVTFHSIGYISRLICITHWTIASRAFNITVRSVQYHLYCTLQARHETRLDQWRPLKMMSCHVNDKIKYYYIIIIIAIRHYCFKLLDDQNKQFISIVFIVMKDELICSFR